LQNISNFRVVCSMDDALATIDICRQAALDHFFKRLF
jgi:hypothetical protein